MSFPERPHPKALEGAILHKAIERFIRALGPKGLPPLGSALFQEALEESDFWGFFSSEREKILREMAPSLGRSSHRLRLATPEEMANQAIRLLREQYRPRTFSVEHPFQKESREGKVTADSMALLSVRGSLTEFEISHPSLPFWGILDLVRFTEKGVEIVDFKTGQEKEDHAYQLHLYALLWWRKTSVCPTKLVIQYLSHSTDFGADEQTLRAVDVRLGAEIAEARQTLAQRPAEARPGSHCVFCAIRARCSVGWNVSQAAQQSVKEGVSDVEVRASTPPGDYGFFGEVGGRKVNLVWEEGVGKEFPEFEKGDHLRLLKVSLHEKGQTLVVEPWTEVYVVPSEG